MRLIILNTQQTLSLLFETKPLPIENIIGLPEKRWTNLR